MNVSKERVLSIRIINLMKSQLCCTANRRKNLEGMLEHIKTNLLMVKEKEIQLDHHPFIFS